jgi:putative transposase
MAKDAVATNNCSIRLVCQIFQISYSCYQYQNKRSEDNLFIAQLLLQLTSTYRNWGFGLCFLYLRNVKGYGWNHKRVYRIYRELELNLRIKPKKRLQRERPEKLVVPDKINECWSMDFMSDNLEDGRKYRLFNVIDDHNREALSMEADISLPAQRVIRILEQLIQWRGKPAHIRCDNGPEYISHKLQKWAIEQRINLLYIQPGKPQQNAYVERFNRTVRYDWLGQWLFDSIETVQNHATKWLWHYNHERPNMALGGITPNQKLMACKLV